MATDEKQEFSARLNGALDAIGIPAKYEGRQAATVALIASEGGSVSQKGARKWLEGEAIPAMDNLVKLARATKTPIQWLATGENIPIADGRYDLPSPIIDIARRLHRLPPKLLPPVVATLEAMETMAGAQEPPAARSEQEIIEAMAQSLLKEALAYRESKKETGYKKSG